jgi:anti-sigma B factor antagonist
MELIKTYPTHEIAYLTLNTAKLDMSNASEFKKKATLAMQDDKNIVLDMAAVDFVDSSGLGAILSCLRDLRSRGGELRLCCVQPRVMVMFELVRMQKVVPLAATREEALDAFALPKAA